jgi:hypothetical protein
MEFQNETEAAEAEAWAGAGCAAPHGSVATRFSFRDRHGLMPISLRTGKLQWVSDRDLCERTARSMGATDLLEMDDAGNVLRQIPLNS